MINKLVLTIYVIVISYCAFSQQWPMIISSNCYDEGATVTQFNDTSFVLIRKHCDNELAKYFVTRFNLNGEITDEEEINQDPEFMLNGIFSVVRGYLGNYYAYGNCEDITNFNEQQTFVLKLDAEFNIVQSYTVGRPDISEYIRSMIAVDSFFFLAGFSLNTSDDFLYKFDKEFNLIGELLIDTATVFGPSKIAMDFDGDELIMFMYPKKAYYVDTGAMVINSTFFIEDVDALSLREVLPLNETKQYVMPFLNISDNPDDTHRNLIIQFRDKDLNLLSETFISNDTLSIIQAPNTLHTLNDDVWLCYTTYLESIYIFIEEINHPIGVMKFNTSGDVIHEGYIDGNANFIAYASLALPDGGH